ncbi:MAG: UDP-N-acetylmuramate dehydrogenase [Alistipes sp.]|nr:UDP-N-acetylmuramate dehydrogenase [Alistipes sp.]
MMRVFEHVDLSGRNSFHVSQRAARLIEFDKADELPALFEQYRPERWMVLSGGNNILFTCDYDGTLITPCGCEISIVAENDSEVEVEVEAGLEWDDLVQWCVEHNLWGIENLSLIPGKVGAAPVQNIGAYGVEAKNAIRAVTMYVPESGKFLTLAAEHCDFGYRESVFKHSLRGKVIITSVTFRFGKKPNPVLGYGDVIREVEARGGATLRNIREAICDIRRSKLPDTEVLGNAGSFFKNPIVDVEIAERLRADYPEMPLYPVAEPGKVKLATGWLIDKAGLKGYREGCVGVHERQALVLVNHGGATGGEVIAFARMVQKRVQERFGIEIDTEVNIL